jgi:hypothetical protein
MGSLLFYMRSDRIPPGIRQSIGYHYAFEIYPEESR